MGKLPIKGACHCGAVRFSVNTTPEFLTECNCSICRRYATQWVYSPENDITLHAPAGTTLAYIWGDEELEFHSCNTCGCTTHWASREGPRFAVNMRLCDPGAVQDIPTRHFDGADSWDYLD